MARREQDREDLLAEATALVERVGLQVAGQPEPWVVGFRRDGSVSFYFGADPVYQFTSSGLLRRAFVDGLIYKAERRRLVSLERQRTTQSANLLRRELRDEEQHAFLKVMRERLSNLASALRDETTRVVGQTPAEADVMGRVRAWLAGRDQPFGIADSPGSN